MNYYKRHIGDYARQAMHLSVLEHGVLTLLTDRYYENEQPFTIEQARRFVRAGSENGVDVALQNVLGEFFHRDEEGRYHSDSIEQALVDAKTRAESARTNGQAGGRPRKTEKKPAVEPTKNEEKPARLPKGADKKTNPLIHKSTNPVEPPKSPKGDETDGDAGGADAGQGEDDGGDNTNAKPETVKYTDSFQRWWSAYPAHRRVAKPQCFRKWKAEKLFEYEAILIDDVTDRLKNDNKWLKSEGQFIPTTQTYLNQQRWNDGKEPIPTSGGGARSATEKANEQSGEAWASNPEGGFNVE